MKFDYCTTENEAAHNTCGVRRGRPAARCSWPGLTHLRPYTLGMVRRVGHGRFIKLVFVLNRSSTQSHASHHTCQLVEHVVANVTERLKQQEPQCKYGK
ncbi:hypothetical protein Y032_0002g613 [Ancylostoma ceylanicum]|uniref:Uncharacterized protein n=1 Tax=Ancylostoma ceylanicum TaxID=53326 RepID=A0A016W0F7_9BILA|nr:hypothetical protein Y032_0002g613 [Ancylostoma ceylanicum]